MNTHIQDSRTLPLCVCVIWSFGVSAHSTHRRRATFDRCEVRGVFLRVVVCGLVLVVCLCVWPASL